MQSRQQEPPIPERNSGSLTCHSWGCFRQWMHHVNNTADPALGPLRPGVCFPEPCKNPQMVARNAGEALSFRCRSCALSFSLCCRAERR